MDEYSTNTHFAHILISYHIRPMFHKLTQVGNYLIIFRTEKGEQEPFESWGAGQHLGQSVGTLPLPTKNTSAEGARKFFVFGTNVLPT